MGKISISNYGIFLESWNKIFKFSPNSLMRKLSLLGGNKAIGYKETFRSLFHPNPNSEFLLSSIRDKKVDKTIIIIRDPRDIWTSAKKRSPELQNDEFALRELIYSWISLVIFGMLFKNDKSILIVTYEKLLANYKNELIRIFDFLNLPTINIEKYYNLEPVSGYGDQQAQKGGEINHQNTKKYYDLPLNERVFIETNCASFFHLFEYEL